MRRMPAWFRRAATFTAWPQMSRAHGPFGKDALSANECGRLAGLGLYLNVQTPGAIRQAHQLGGGALSYLSFYDTYVHTEGFENGTARVPWDGRAGQMLLLDERGRFVNTPMDETWRMWRYLVCNNTREYVERALAMVRRQMEAGADGLFVDNSGRRRPCYGHGVPAGYSRKYRGVCAAMPRYDESELAAGRLPEELYARGKRPRIPTGNPEIRNLPVHRHIYPDKSHLYAYRQLLRKVGRVVRSYGRDKVIVVNGAAMAEEADATMLESYICSWTWTDRKTNRKELAAKWAPYIASGRKVLALSYVGHTRYGAAEDALYCYAAAMLSDFMWSDYGTGAGKACERLRKLNLGRRRSEPAEVGDAEVAWFEDGLVAVNDGRRKRALWLEMPPAVRRGWGGRRLVNVADGGELQRRGDAVRLELPAHGGRVCVAARTDSG